PQPAARRARKRLLQADLPRHRDRRHGTNRSLPPQDPERLHARADHRPVDQQPRQGRRRRPLAVGSDRDDLSGASGAGGGTMNPRILVAAALLLSALGAAAPSTRPSGSSSGSSSARASYSDLYGILEDRNIFVRERSARRNNG